MQQITGTPSAHCVVLANTYGYQGILEHAITAWRINILLHGVRMQQMYARIVLQAPTARWRVRSSVWIVKQEHTMRFLEEQRV